MAFASSALLSPPFCDFTWLSPKSSFSTLPLKNFDEVQRCFELLHRDGLRHHIRWILLHADLYQIDHLIIHDPLTYLLIPHINVLRPLVIPMILSEMNRTLAIVMTRTESCMILNVLTNPINHKAFFDASTAAMYSASVIESAVVSCSSAFQLMMHSLL